MKTILVFGASGFIGGHLCSKLKKEKNIVIGVDLNKNKYWSKDIFSKFYIKDLKNYNDVNTLLTKYKPNELYQLAADMGGAGYIFSGLNDANVMSNSLEINLNTLKSLSKNSLGTKVFFSSSACVYSGDSKKCTENSVYPANPDSAYGWEKLISEKLYLSYFKNYKLNIRIARFHNIFGPKASWNNGREKSIAAICRKIIEAGANGKIEIWGDGKQTRSYLYIDECLKGIEILMKSQFSDPINIGSDKSISINNLIKMIEKIAGYKVQKEYIDGPVGVRDRNSCNKLIQKTLMWSPDEPLIKGVEKTFKWIKTQILKN